MMAAVQRLNQDPRGWLRKLSSSATVAGRTAIARLLSTLPDAIAGSMRGNAPLPAAAPGYWCQAVEMHQVRLKLAVNLGQIRDFCTELNVSAPHDPVESYG